MTTTLTNSDSQSTLPFRKKRGRPPLESPRNRPVDRAAAEIAEKIAIPPAPGKKLSFEQAQEYFKLLTPDMWSHVVIYLYRTRPRIIRQLKDPDLKNYIDCVSQPIDMEYMIQRHGGGSYYFEVNDTEAKREDQHLFRCIFEVDQVRYEPKLNYEELDVNHRDNMSYIQYLQHKGVLTDKGQVVTNQQTPSPAGVHPDVIKHMVDLVNTMNANSQEALRTRLATAEDNNLSKSIGQILVERMKQDDPSKHLEVVSTVLNTVEKFAAHNKPNSDINLAQILQMQSDQRKTDLEYMKLILESRTPPAQDANQFAHFREVFNWARDIMGAARGGNPGGIDRSGWDIGLEYAKELVIPGLQTLNNWLSLKRGVPGAPITPGPGSGPAPTRAFDPYKDQAALRAASLAAQQGAPAPAPGPAPAPQAQPGNGPQAAAAAGPGELLPILQQYGNLLVNALNNGTTGFDFADSIVLLVGTGTHALLTAQGEEALLKTVMMVPEIAIFGEMRLRTFIHEFVHYEKFLQEADTGHDEN